MKKIIFKLFGLKTYLKFLSVGFSIAYKTGLLRRNYLYKYHYFDKYFVCKGDHVMDIGANLGYYTRLFSEWTSGGGQ